VEVGSLEREMELEVDFGSLHHQVVEVDDALVVRRDLFLGYNHFVYKYQD
jgi:hypothetical protein